MGLILVGSKLSTSKNGKAKEEAKQEKTQRTDWEVIPKNEVPVQREEILNDNGTSRDK